MSEETESYLAPLPEVPAHPLFDVLLAAVKSWANQTWEARCEDVDPITWLDSGEVHALVSGLIASMHGTVAVITDDAWLAYPHSAYDPWSDV